MALTCTKDEKGKEHLRGKRKGKEGGEKEGKKASSEGPVL